MFCSQSDTDVALIPWTTYNQYLHCLKSVRIRSHSGPHFPVFGLNRERDRISPYSVRMRENADQNNSEHGHFLQIALILKLLTERLTRVPQCVFFT